MCERSEIGLTPTTIAKQFIVSSDIDALRINQGELNAQTESGDKRPFLQSDVDKFSREQSGVNKSGSPGTITVLVVDDNVQFAGYLEELLSEFPQLKVEVASDGFDASIKIRDGVPDVVIIDLMMPGINGVEVCQRLKSSPETSHIRVFAMTGYPTSENVQNALAAGAEVCLAKPLHRNDIFELLGLNA